MMFELWWMTAGLWTQLANRLGGRPHRIDGLSKWLVRKMYDLARRGDEGRGRQNPHIQSGEIWSLTVFILIGFLCLILYEINLPQKDT